MREDSDGSSLPAPKRHGALALVSLIAAIVCCLIVVGVVLKDAWISEDSFITFRYVDNTVNGRGAVFNVGEKVQGYTHPLWFLLLLPAYFVVRDPMFVAVGYGLLLTAMTIGGLAVSLLRATHRPPLAALLVAIASSVFISSDPWVSFQTGGLENALSHFLLLLVGLECVNHGISRPHRLAWLLALLCLTRPDFVLFALPLGLFILCGVRSWRQLGILALAAFPCVAWILFSWLYYGDPVPNTAHAKIGIFPSHAYAIRTGAIYLLNWITFDTLAAAAAALFLACALIWTRRTAVRVCILGLVLHGLWVVWVGGDFMLGRFFTPALTLGLVLGTLVLASRTDQKDAFLAVATIGVLLLLITSATFVFGRSARHRFREAFIRPRIENERAFYPGYAFRYYLKHNRRPSSPYVDLALADNLRAYAERYSSLTIHFGNPGTLGYFAGPNVHVIDTLGLTDSFIASLPREHLVSKHPRPGHPDKYIPVRYLASRGDVAILDDWKTAVREMDSTLPARAAAEMQSELFLAPNGKLVSRPHLAPAGPPLEQ